MEKCQRRRNIAVDRPERNRRNHIQRTENIRMRRCGWRQQRNLTKAYSVITKTLGQNGYSATLERRAVMNIEKRFYEAWFDGSTNHHKKRSGIGGVIISPDGQVVAKYSMEIPYIPDSRKVEYIALIKLTEKLLELGVKNVDIKTDFKGLCDSIKFGGSRKYNRLNPGEEITKLHIQALDKLDKLTYYMINWVPRRKNRRADRLSKKYKKINRRRSNHG